MKVKIKKKFWIVLLIIVLILVIGIAVFLKKINYKIEVIDEVEGTYSGYQLILTTSYGGYGEARTKVRKWKNY
jgi:hypothetical protein